MSWRAGLRTEARDDAGFCLGGGFGEPGERDRAALTDDFLDGKISAAKIKRDYGIDIEKVAAGKR